MTTKLLTTRTLLWILGACVFFVLFKTYEADPRTVWSALTLADVWILLFAALVQSTVPFLRAGRWMRLRCSRSDHITFGSALAVTSASAVVASITPARLGEASRLAMKGESGRRALPDLTAEYFADGWILLVLALSFGCVEGKLVSLPVALALGLVLVGVAPHVYALAPRVLKLLPFNRVRAYLDEAKIGEATPWISVLVYGFGIHVVTFGSAVLAFDALSSEVPTLTLIKGLVIGQLVGIFSLLPMGFGTREAGVAGVLALADYSGEDILAALVCHRVITTFVVAAFGVLSIRSLARSS